MSALAAEYLEANNPEVIGFIGAVEQAKAHFLEMKAVFPSLKVCKVSSRTKTSEDKFIAQMRYFHPDARFIACSSSYQDAVKYAEYVVTAISAGKDITSRVAQRRQSILCSCRRP